MYKRILKYNWVEYRESKVCDPIRFSMTIEVNNWQRVILSPLHLALTAIFA